MDLTLTCEEIELLAGILKQRHRELLNEIAHTDHHEFRKSLRRNERMLESILTRLRATEAEQLLA